MVTYFFAVVAAQALAPAAPPSRPVICDPFMLFFDAGRAELTPAAHGMIDKIVAVKDDLKPFISVIGYADAPGSERYNLALSRRRAEAVKVALIAKGVPPGMIMTGARGESSFFVETNASEMQNRRVQVSTCEKV